MLNIKKLEVNKLIKEFEYLKSDYEYKSELIREADSSFFNDVDKILNSNSELKIIYEEKNGKTEDIHIEEYIEKDIDIESYDEEELYKEDTRSDKIKKLYREIAKLTHPDKVFSDALNNLYIEASNYYDSNNILGIYKICEDLSIDFELDMEEIMDIKRTISVLRERILFIENTHVWSWYNEVDHKKDKMILEFIRSKIL